MGRCGSHLPRSLWGEGGRGSGCLTLAGLPGESSSAIPETELRDGLRPGWPHARPPLGAAGAGGAEAGQTHGETAGGGGLSLLGVQHPPGVPSRWVSVVPPTLASFCSVLSEGMTSVNECHHPKCVLEPFPGNPAFSFCGCSWASTSFP